MPGFTFPAVGSLGLCSPPSQSEPSGSHHRYYVRLRLPDCPSRIARSLGLLFDTLPAFSSLSFPLGLLQRLKATPGGQVSWSAGTPCFRPSMAGRQQVLPSSRATPMSACPALRARGADLSVVSSCSPSPHTRTAAFRHLNAVGFPPAYLC